MRLTERVNASVRSSCCVALACFSVLSTSLSRGLAVPQQGSLTQALVTYGYLVSHYPDEFVLGHEPGTPLATGIKDLTDALNSLGCDVPSRLAFPHRALIVLPSSARQWAGFAGAKGRPPEEATLFVIDPPLEVNNRRWVVLSSVAPEQTTVFWIEPRKQGYTTWLVYDTFKKGNVKNHPKTAIGAITGVSVEKTGVIFLKEWAELGSRPRHMGKVGRVFRIDPSSGDVTLHFAGRLPVD
jgi:hypothetical protein